MSLSSIIRLADDAEDNGLAHMLVGLVRQNLEDHPRKWAAFNRLVGRVAIVATDIDVSLTMCFDGGALVVHDGIHGIPDVTVQTEAEHITELSLVEIGRFGLPDPRGPHTRGVLRASLDGRIHVHGLLGNVPTMLRLTELMSVN